MSNLLQYRSMIFAIAINVLQFLLGKDANPFQKELDDIKKANDELQPKVQQALMVWEILKRSGILDRIGFPNQRLSNLMSADSVSVHEAFMVSEKEFTPEQQAERLETVASYLRMHWDEINI